MFYVYLITNRKNGKIYVGEAKDLKGRWNKHINVAANIGTSQSAKEQAYAVHYAIRKHGSINFDFDAVAEVENRDKALELEKWCIAFLKEVGYKLYNETDGGDCPPPKRGEESPLAKLNNNKVMEIKFLLKHGRSQSAIAEQFGVSRSAILRINSGKGWSHINITEEMNLELENRYLSDISLREQFEKEISDRRATAQLGKTPWNKDKEMSIEYRKTAQNSAHSAKFTEAQVREIKSLIEAGMKSGEIAKKFNVSRPLITRIKTGKTWKYVV